MECVVRDELSVAGGIVPWLMSLESTIVGIAPQVSHLDANLATYTTNHTTLVARLFDHLDQAQAHQDAASKALVDNFNGHTALLNTLAAQVTAQTNCLASLVSKTNAYMDCIATHQDSLVDMAKVVNRIDSRLEAMATLHDCIDSHLQWNNHPVDALSAQLNNHAQQVNSMLNPLGQSVARMEKCLNALSSISADANPHAMASQMATMAHNNALHPTILESPDVDCIDHNLPSPSGGISALPAQRWTGVNPSLFGPKRTVPQLGVDASGPPKRTTPQHSVDASKPQQQSTSE
jgi:hypothetical protein